MARARSLRPWLWTGPALAVVGILVVFPVAYTLGISLSNLGVFSWQDPQFVGLRNYERLLFGLDAGFWSALGFSLAWTAANLALQAVLAFGLAWLLATPGLRGAGIYRSLILVPWALPAYLSALVWRNGLFNADHGLVNRCLAGLGLAPVAWLSEDGPAFVALLVVNLWLSLPFLTVVTLGGLAGIAREHYDAAAIDGASTARTIRAVTLPLIRPVLAPALLATAFINFKQFDLVYLMLHQRGAESGSSLQSLVSYAYEKAFVTNNYGLSAALSTLIFLIMLALTLASLRGRRALP